MVAEQVYIPVLLSAAVVLITLLYASVLDVRERRVPFRTWLPMICIGLLCISYFFWDQTKNGSFVCGYLALVAVFLYDDYLSNRGRRDIPGLTWYYRESAIFYYLPVTLFLPALSWVFLNGNGISQTLPWYGMFAVIVLYVSYIVFKAGPDDDRIIRKKGEAKPVNRISVSFCRWYFVLVVIIFTIISLLMLFGSWRSAAIVLVFLTVFCGIFYIFGTMNLFGWADAWALIFISLCVPIFPITPLFGEPPVGVFSFSVLINALLLNLIVPVLIFFINIARGTRGPLMYMFFGFPVKGEEIRSSWGFVMEDISEKNGKIQRHFIGFWDTIRRMYKGTGRIYTKALRENPERYERELNMYKKAGMVWISYAVPFIVPITAGFITAIFFGDFLYMLMKFIAGA